MFNFLIIEKMKIAASRQIAISVPQTMVRFMPHMWPGMLTRLLPIAVATKHPPIIMPLYLTGETYVTNEIPIGLNSNSAKVRMR